MLLLDEPTNDLDVNTMRALEEALESFAGCAIVISHDRWFLDRVATHILAFEGDSRVYLFDGKYSEYEEEKRKRPGTEADQPHRIRYRQMTRRGLSIARLWGLDESRPGRIPRGRRPTLGRRKAREDFKNPEGSLRNGESGRLTKYRKVHISCFCDNS